MSARPLACTAELVIFLKKFVDSSRRLRYASRRMRAEPATYSGPEPVGPPTCMLGQVELRQEPEDAACIVPAKGQNLEEKHER